MLGENFINWKFSCQADIAKAVGRIKKKKAKLKLLTFQQRNYILLWAFGCKNVH